MTAGDLWRAIGEELVDELALAVFLVPDIVDVDALDVIEFRAALVAQHAWGWGFMLGCEAKDAVLVGAAAADSWWHHKLAADAPDVRLWALRDVESPALALGLGLPSKLTLAAIDQKRATWLRIVVEGARRENWQLPAPAAEPRKLRMREVRR